MIAEKLFNKINSKPEELEEKPYRIDITLSPDHLEAYLNVEIFDENARIKKSDIFEAIKEKHISFGIHTHLIDDVVRKSEAVNNLEIAKGIPMKDGVDGVLTYNFDTSNSNKPTINEDGSVDFKNIHFLIPTKKGDVLATRTLPTEGVDGTLVTGKVMKARSGRMVNFKVGKNVEISEDGLSVISICDGSIKFDGSRLSVIAVLEIYGDVGVKTGNINFAGKVVVHGDVRSGYEVVATDDIVVNGLVESAIVKTKKDLVINHGVQGNDAAELCVGGNLVVKFINAAKVECSGDITADSIMHSFVNCKSEIKAEGKNGLIIGGKVYSRKSIQSKCIGSKMGTTSFLSVGISPEFLENIKDLIKKKEELLANIKKVDKVISLMGKNNDLDSEKKLVCEKSSALKEEHQTKLQEIEEEIASAEEDKKNMSTASIKCGDIFPGSRIKIDNKFHTITERVLGVEFKKEKGSIVMHPWEE